jgi:N-ethylmaleimide reductase
MSLSTNLLTPCKIGSLELSNRVFMAPLTRCRAGGSRVPNEFMKQYYESRASAGLIITEATAISEQGYGQTFTPGCYTEEQSKGWKQVVDAVHAKGGTMFLQLWHMGRAGHPSFHPTTNEIVAPSAIPLSDDHVYGADGQKYPPATPRALKLDEIPGVVEQYRISAQFAKDAGFDGVEIHAANGFLIDQFLQSCSNIRSDAYGGSLENRYRFLKEVVEVVTQVYSPDHVGVRISPNGVYNCMGSDDNDKIFPYVAKQLSAYGLAYIHCVDGMHWGFHGKCRSLTLYDIKVNFGNGFVIGNGGFTGKDQADGALRSGGVDAIAFGSLYLSNPDLVARFKNNWPINPPTPYNLWYGVSPEPKECLEGYLGYDFYKVI